MKKNLLANTGDIRDAGSAPGWEDPLEEGIEPTPVFLPGESHGQRSLAGYSPWGRKELDINEETWHTHSCKTLHKHFLSDQPMALFGASQIAKSG